MRYEGSILEIINDADMHMTAEQIFLVLKERYPAVVLATVYNNLNKLLKNGKIRKISAEGHPDRYDKNTVHDHLVCSCCGALQDAYLPNITEQLVKQLGFSIQGYDLKIKYVCSKCQMEQQASDTTKKPDCS